MRSPTHKPLGLRARSFRRAAPALARISRINGRAESHPESRSPVSIPLSLAMREKCIEFLLRRFVRRSRFGDVRLHTFRG
jgi:hypothetical protein